MLSNRSVNNSGNSTNHRRQWSEGIFITDKSARFYKDDDRQLVSHLINEYLLEGSPVILDLLRNSSNECFEALVDVIWLNTSQTMDSNEDDLLIHNQRSSLLSSSPSNVHRQQARRRLAIIFIEVFKLLSLQTSFGGRFDIQRQQRLLTFPDSARLLINYEPDISGLSCLAFASMILINPLVIHHQIQLVTDVLKYAANQFVKANLSFETTSTFGVSIYALFYLLYLLYPNNLRRELQLDISAQTNISTEKTNYRLGVERVLLPLCYQFKLQPNIVCSTIENEKQENRWSNDSWQQIIANGDRYVVSDDISPLFSNDFKKQKEDDSKTSFNANRFEISSIIRMCNDYAESVLHQSDKKSQIIENTVNHGTTRKGSNDDYSTYCETFCQTYEQQWQTTIQNGQMKLLRAQTQNESNHRQNNQNNGNLPKKDSQHHHSRTPTDHNIHAKVQLQLAMLDCNYEQDKREYYAQSIRESKKTMGVNDVDKQLKHQEIQYEQLLNEREKICKGEKGFSELRGKIKEFSILSDEFYESLSSTRAEFKSDDDAHWLQTTSMTRKHSKLIAELDELEETKKSLENQSRELSRPSFSFQRDAKQYLEMSELIEKLSVELICARKKHQLLHNALVQLKLKATNAEKLIVLHENDELDQSVKLDEKKKKFEELKQLIERQHLDLTAKRNNFHQTRNMNTHKINVIRRQIDSTRVCQAQLITSNRNSQMIDK